MSQLPCTQTNLIEPAYRYSYNLWEVHWSVQAMIPASEPTSRTIRCSVQLGRQQLPQLLQKNSNSDFTKQGFTAERARLLRATWTHLGTDRVLLYSYCIITRYSACKGCVYVESESWKCVWENMLSCHVSHSIPPVRCLWEPQIGLKANHLPPGKKYQKQYARSCWPPKVQMQISFQLHPFLANASKASHGDHWDLDIYLTRAWMPALALCASKQLSHSHEFWPLATGIIFKPTIYNGKIFTPVVPLNHLKNLKFHK